MGLIGLRVQSALTMDSAHILFDVPLVVAIHLVRMEEEGVIRVPCPDLSNYEFEDVRPTSSHLTISSEDSQAIHGKAYGSPYEGCTQRS